MNIGITNEILNVGTVQRIMDQTVFDYVDTTENNEKAYEILDDLLHQVANYFNSQIEQSGGELPKRNTYWTLFMDVVSKLIYFNGLTHMQLIDKEDSDACQHILGMYQTSARCLPNARTSENIELLEEIQKSVQQLPQRAEGHEKLETSGTLEECLTSFYELTKTYK